MFELLAIPVILLILILVLTIPLIVVYLFIRLTEEAFERVGFDHWHASLMVFGSIVGSMVDLPLHPSPISSYPQWLISLAGPLSLTFPATFHPVYLMVNLGGCLIPMLISLDLLRRGRASAKKALAGTLFVALVTYQMATPLANQGIVLPVYVAPTLAALTGIALARGYDRAPSLAYISGAMGTLLGADIFNLLTPGVLATLSPPTSQARPLVLSIGGAGVFDGIFLTGVLAVLLAAMIVCLFPGSTCRRTRVPVR
ncbi:MAG: DUF1614 domain-containing protein [Methanosarcinales archaeon]|nr:DUF1614 domain-containing protein [Methanosarcinales archaeon]